MTCVACGADLPAYAYFCGECGRAVPTSAPLPRPSSAMPLSAADHAAPPNPERGLVSLPEPAPCAECGAALGVSDIFCGECGLVTPAGTVRHAPGTGVSESPGSPGSPASADAEEPMPTGSGDQRLSFVLQFSTGDSFTVTGTGLVGRNPRAEPGEIVDRLIAVVDPTRSVSKTHLEFGQEGGVFWVSDRFSGNGTVLREPGAAPKRILPDRRHLIARGTRIDMGEQFFVVS